MEIRVLTAADVTAYRPLRLQALREHPEAFGSAYEDECALTSDEMAARIRPHEHYAVFGAFMGEQLVGMVSFHRYAGRKTRHRAMLGALYVQPQMRRQKVGSELLTAVIHYARTQAGLEELLLAVTVGNAVARGLYLRARFAPSHVEQRYIKVNDDYYDIEWMTLRVSEK